MMRTFGCFRFCATHSVFTSTSGLAYPRALMSASSTVSDMSGTSGFGVLRVGVAAILALFPPRCRCDRGPMFTTCQQHPRPAGEVVTQLDAAPITGAREPARDLGRARVRELQRQEPARAQVARSVVHD